MGKESVNICNLRGGGVCLRGTFKCGVPQGELPACPVALDPIARFVSSQREDYGDSDKTRFKVSTNDGDRVVGSWYTWCIEVWQGHYQEHNLSLMDLQNSIFHNPAPSI